MVKKQKVKKQKEINQNFSAVSKALEKEEAENLEGGPIENKRNEDIFFIDKPQKTRGCILSSPYSHYFQGSQKNKNGKQKL
jgi:hypothetical protein